ncbi:M23 family metallopeptidase [Sphingomonas sp. LY160]|uniref:M23 family metallopeptidase n=1 Tax=Sphingomonas sp. LY160 TaxID=3095342 RepID=UPI002ADEEF0B|nr:M23 family metallopeptidase [Sphingomonas sp. LY160]MEA1072496.1 M23 family metallopeptidase [Sphingomonas sp. LY160]
MRAHWRTAPAIGPAPTFGRRARTWREFDLRADLAEDLLSPRWWRGAATLALLCGTVGLLAPAPFEPLPAGQPDLVGSAEAEQFRAAAIGTAISGSRTGGRMAATTLVEPLTHAPERPTIELFAKLGTGDTIARLLARAGVGFGEAGHAARLIAESAPGGIAPGTSISIRLGRRTAAGTRPIDRVALRAGLDLNLAIVGGANGLSVEASRIAVDATPLRVRGRVGDGLYWALRSSGVGTQTASEYLRAIGGVIDVGGGVGPDDRFDLIISNRRAATGENQSGPLLYAAIERSGAPAVRLMKWTVGGRTEWIDTAGVGRQVAAMAWPVQGRITSGFGPRVHPILRFARMHKGIDFGAPSGAPIVAASDGQVALAGWAGGYGRQVRIAHGGGLMTSYSHMSRLVVESGSMVRAGQLIGYVGSSGLSTGPHLHYEVYRDGRPVNPMGVKFASRSLLDGDNLTRFKARLGQLMAVGTRE